MKLDTAPITVATTALTIPAIAPWEAEKEFYRYYFRIESYVKLVLAQSKFHERLKTNKHEIVGKCSNQLFLFVNNEK